MLRHEKLIDAMSEDLRKNPGNIRGMEASMFSAFLHAHVSVADACVVFFVLDVDQMIHRSEVVAPAEAQSCQAFLLQMLLSFAYADAKKECGTRRKTVYLRQASHGLWVHTRNICHYLCPGSLFCRAQNCNALLRPTCLPMQNCYTHRFVTV